jgi:transcriptional regulator with XRE-family HTH domain
MIMQSTAGERIKNARKKAGLSQKQLSAKYGIPARSIEDWETNKHKCPDYVLNLLLDRIALDYVADLTEAVREEIYFGRVALEDDNVTAEELADERLTAERLTAERLSAEQPLSKKEPTTEEPTQKKPYILCDMSGNPLSQSDSKFVHQERAAGRTGKVILSEDEDPYHTRKVFYCTANNLKFEVTKEV